MLPNDLLQFALCFPKLNTVQQQLVHSLFWRPQVFPEQMDIRAKSSATFRVAFRPPLDGQYFCQTLEVVACFKAHRSFRGVAEGAVLPPWTLPVQVRHTVSQTASHPHLQIQPQHLWQQLACIPGALQRINSPARSSECWLASMITPAS